MLIQEGMELSTIDVSGETCTGKKVSVKLFLYLEDSSNFAFNKSFAVL